MENNQQIMNEVINKMRKEEIKQNKKREQRLLKCNKAYETETLKGPPIN